MCIHVSNRSQAHTAMVAAMLAYDLHPLTVVEGYFGPGPEKFATVYASKDFLSVRKAITDLRQWHPDGVVINDSEEVFAGSVPDSYRGCIGSVPLIDGRKMLSIDIPGRSSPQLVRFWSAAYGWDAATHDLDPDGLERLLVRLLDDIPVAELDLAASIAKAGFSGRWPNGYSPSSKAHQ